MTSIEQIYIKHKKKQKNIAIIENVINSVKSYRKIIKDNKMNDYEKAFSLKFLPKYHSAIQGMIVSQPIILPKDRKKCFKIPQGQREDKGLLKINNDSIEITPAIKREDNGKTYVLKLDSSVLSKHIEKKIKIYKRHQKREKILKKAEKILRYIKNPIKVLRNEKRR